MAVYTTGGGGGVLGGLAGVMGLIPGMQIPAALLGAGNALANGDPMGAVTSAAGMINPAGNAAKAAVNPAAAAGMPGTGGQTGSLINALAGVANGTYGQGMPTWGQPDISALSRNPWARTWYNSAGARKTVW